MEKATPDIEMGTEKLIHLTASSEGLDKELIYPYRAIIEMVIKKESDEWGTVQSAFAIFFAQKMREYSNRYSKYHQYVFGLNELAIMASEGHRVNTIINTSIFDFKKLWVGIDKIMNGVVFKNELTYGGLGLYPIKIFPSNFKKEFLYNILEKSIPDFMRLVIKNKILMYVTSDFNYAVSSDILQREDLAKLVENKKHGNMVLMPDGVKIYLVDGI